MTETRKITLQFPSLRAFLAEYGERISAEGMLLRGEAPPAAGSTVDIEVVVAEGMRLLRARGETLWSGAAGAGSPQQAAAVRFRDLDEASRTLIAKIVDQRRREGAEPFQLADVPGPREARLRDLTVPAAAIGAEPVESAAAAPDAIFDLAQTPAATATDLFAPLAAGKPAPSAPEPAVPEPPASAPPVPEPFAFAPPAPERKLKAPVPLLADPEPGPFDLDPSGAVLDEGLEAADLRLGAAPEEEAETATVDSDLSDLFGGDEPQMAPARGRTEAFPPSFVDEVEAELRATETPDSSYLDVDTGELEIQLGGPLTEPEPPGEQPAEPAPAPPIEPAPAPPIEPAPAPPIEPAPAPPMEPAPAPPVEPVSEAPARGAPEPEIEIEPEVAPEPGIELDLGMAPEPEVEIELEVPPQPAVEVSLEPEPQPKIALQLESEVAPEIPPERSPEPAPAPEPMAEPGLGAGPQAAPDSDLAERVAQAFDAAQGRETVEIPIIAPPAPPPAPLAPGTASPPQPAASPLPPAGRPAPRAPTVPLDDNLLSIPELSPDPPSAAPLDEQRRGGAPADLPSSAQALRGAAGSSRHLGTWFLIALLAGALAVAGYLLWGLARDDGGFLQPADRASVPVSPPAQPAAGTAAPAAAPEGAGSAGPEATPPPPAVAAEPAPGVEPGAATEQPAPAAPVATDPPSPLTGLDRITWNEIGSETVLALVGDGAIERRGVELVTIGGAQPRLVIKISGVQRAFQPAVLEVGTTQVDKVRTGLHADGELHVVIDLAAAGVAVRDLAVDGPRLELRLGTELGAE